MSAVSSRVEACRRFLLRRGGWAAGLFGAAGLVLAFPVAWLVVGARGDSFAWGHASAGPLAVWLLALAAAAAGALFAHRNYRRWADERILTHEMEGAAGLPSGRIQAQLELSRGGGSASVPISAPPHSPLIALGESKLLPHLAVPESALVGEGGRVVDRLLRRGGAGLALALGLVVALGVLSPDRARVALAGLADPVGVLRPPALPDLAVTPGDAEVPRGAVVPIQVQAEGRGQVTLVFRSPGRVPTTLVAAPNAQGQVQVLSPVVESETTYWVEDPRGGRSLVYVLTPVDPVLFASVRVTFVYPPHTGLEPMRLPYLPPAFSVPAGTRIELEAQLDDANADTEALIWVREGTGGQPGVTTGRFEVLGGELSGEGVPDVTGRYRWAREGGSNAGRPLPPSLQVEVVPDAPPVVGLEIREADPDGRGATLRLRVSDDWGLDWVELEWQVASGGELRPVRTERVPLANAPSVVLEPRVQLVGEGLPPGGRIRIQARAADRGVGPGIGVSGHLEFLIPDAAALREQARDDVADASDRIEALAASAAEDEAQLRALARELEAREAAAEADQAMGRTDAAARAEDEALAGTALEAAAQARANLVEEIEGVRDALEQAAQAAGPGAEADALRTRIAALDRLLEDLLAELGAPPPGGDVPASEALAEAAQLQETLRDRLEAATERFRRAVLENELEAAGEAARDLAQRLDSIAANTRDPAADAADAAARDRAQTDAGALEDRARELEAQLREAGDSTAAARALEAAERSAEVREAIERGEPRDMVEASQAAQEAGEALEEARAQLEAQAEARALAGIRQAALSAIALSELQRGVLAADADSETAEGRSGRASRQAALVEGFRNLGFGLRISLLAMGGVPQLLGEAMSEVTLALDRALVLLRQSEQQGVPPQESRFAEVALRAALGLHEVALRVFETADAEDELPFGDSGEATAGAGGGGDEGSATSEAVEQVAGEQEALNRQIEEAAGRGAGEASAQEIEALSRAQEAVGSALESLANRAGETERSALLERLADEAEALAEALRGAAQTGRLEASVISRQEAFLERLLDAGRTLERDAPTETREGTPSGFVPVRIPVPALPTSALQGAPRLQPTPEALARLSPAERQLVLDYFARLQRGGGGR